MVIFVKRISLIAPPGFEPGSQAPKACILDHWTMGLSLHEYKIHELINHLHEYKIHELINPIPKKYQFISFCPTNPHPHSPHPQPLKTKFPNL